MRKKRKKALELELELELEEKNDDELKKTPDVEKKEEELSKLRGEHNLVLREEHKKVL